MPYCYVKKFHLLYITQALSLAQKHQTTYKFIEPIDKNAKLSRNRRKVMGLAFVWAFPEVGSHWEAALILGAINVATAPAAIMAIVNEYNSKGKMTTVLLGVVAIDDIVDVLIFALVMSTIGPVGVPGLEPTETTLLPALHILIAIGIGLASAFILAVFDKFNTVLAATLLNEFISPFLVKRTLQNAGDIVQ